MNLGRVGSVTVVMSAVMAIPGAGATARPLALEDVPAPLKPWVGWALRGHEAERCPSLPGDDGERLCAWSGRLELTLDARGGRFRQEWEVLAESAVPLPGDGSRWPVDVRADGKAAMIVAGDGAPTVRLSPGRHLLTGSFQWRRLPESLRVPPESGLVALTVGGRRMDFPDRNDDQLFLGSHRESLAETDSLDIAVHRKVTDDVPLLLSTRLQLAVAGKAREVVLGKALPPGFVPHALAGDLPARLEPDGRLRVQLRPGKFTVTLDARRETQRASLRRPDPEGTWKEGDEAWVFDARPALRVVTVEGVPAVDPRQTTLPPDWQRLPAYIMSPGATMNLVEHRRGDAEPAADQLSLQRHLWLDFDGHGYTARDQISGRMTREWRLSMGPEVTLGRVAANGADQFITRTDGGPAGVEIRQSQLSVEADSRMEGARRNIAAVGWAHDFQSAAATLSLPPGWRLVHVRGADSAGPTWIKSWTLLDIFLVLVVAAAVARLFGRRVGLLALVTLVLIAQEHAAPGWAWLAFLVGEALVRALPVGRLQRVLRLYRLGTVVGLVMIAIPFAVEQVRAGLYPALGDGSGYTPGFAGRESDDRFMQLATRVAAPASAPPESPPPAAIGDVMSQEEGKSDRSDGPSPKRRAAVDKLKSNGLLRMLGSAAPAKAPAPASQNIAAYDPQARVQTGPGIPTWTWTDVALGWSGPVAHDTRLSLWLLPPWLTSLLAFVRVALLAWLLLVVLRQGLLESGRRVFGLPLLLLALAGLASPAAAADFPAKELLDDLRAGLVEPPACAPRCATFGRMLVEATPERLRLRLEASAAARAAVPLPGGARQWSPDSVLVDGKAAGALHRDDGGLLWLLLPPGSHQVVLEGLLPGRPVVQIPLGRVRPHVVSAVARGWALEGVDEDGVPRDTLELTRTAGPPGAPRGGAAKALESQSLPPFVFVERTLLLGLKWEVETRIVRATPAGAAVVLDVPLLPRESVLTEGVKVAAGRVKVNMAAGDSETRWRSVLEQRARIDLRAPPPAEAPWAEVWRLDLGPIWHATFSGIPPVHPGDAPAALTPEWRPWPGESVVIDVTRPGAADGQTLTIDASHLELQPGSRSTAATLVVPMRSSRGAQHAFVLPEGATLESLDVDGRAQPPRQQGRDVTLSLGPGRQVVRLKFRAPRGLSPAFRTPEIDLGAPSVNADVSVTLPQDRWVLLAGGPRLGPAVLAWSALAIVLLVGAALGRTSLTPLRARHWILLGLGFVTLSVPAAAVVAGYFLALGWRRTQLKNASATLYDLGQVLLVAWTLLAAGILFVAVERGLLASPDMQVAGNGSTISWLHWSSDRAAGSLPTGWVVSLPSMVYHVVMLAWALWLAGSVIRWARWAWACFTEGGLWRALRKRPT